MAQHTIRKWKITTSGRRLHMALDEQQDHAPYFAQPKDQWRRILFALQQH
jgi:hypothetical protein